MVVTRLYFEIPDNNGSTVEHTIDLARELSKHHRRLVRQKQLFTVYGGIYQDSGETNPTNAYISTAPHYWVTKRSINRGFKAWKKQISEAMSNSADNDISAPLRTGKWSDFKIYLDDNGATNLLSAKDASGQDLPSGEWNYTTVTMPRPDSEDLGETGYISHSSDQFEMFICGQHVSSGSGISLNYSRVGLIKSWLESRPIPIALSNDVPNDQDEAIMIADPLTKMFLTGDADEDEKIIEAINDENDFPPYDADKLFGASGLTGTNSHDLQMQCIVSPDSNTGVAAVAGFQALCGLLRIRITGDTGSNGAALILDVESNGVRF
jgi:hypothetical protein